MKFHQSNLLKQFSNITSVFTTKQSKNLAFHVGDVADNVIKNHKLLANDLQYQYKTLVHMKQIHSNIVLKVTQEHNFFNPPTCDALITDEKNIALMVMVADCAPLLFYHPKKELIGVAHAGRAGAFSNITQNVLTAFSLEYDAKSEDIMVSIGPSIAKCCYEVGQEIDLEAKKLGLSYAMEKKGEKYFLDIRKILQTQLLNAGVKAANIEIAQECTCCEKEHFNSYRAQKDTGRFAGVISLKS